MNHGIDAARLEDVEHAQETNALLEELQNSIGSDQNDCYNLQYLQNYEHISKSQSKRHYYQFESYIKKII